MPAGPLEPNILTEQVSVPTAEAELCCSTKIVRVKKMTQGGIVHRKGVIVFVFDDGDVQRITQRDEWRQSTILYEGAVKSCMVFISKRGKHYATFSGMKANWWGF
jgi:hypothetical protein